MGAACLWYAHSAGRLQRRLRCDSPLRVSDIDHPLSRQGKGVHAVMLPFSIIHAFLPSLSFFRGAVTGAVLNKGSQSSPTGIWSCLLDFCHKIKRTLWLRRFSSCVCNRCLPSGSLAGPCTSNLVFILRGSALTTAAWRISSGDWINYKPMSLPDYWTEQCMENVTAYLCNSRFEDWMFFVYFSLILSFLICR